MIIMTNGWILCNNRYDDPETIPYELERFLDEAPRSSMELRLVQAEQIDIMVPQQDRSFVLLDKEAAPLPDFMLCRLGADVSYHGLAVIRMIESLGVMVINAPHAIDMSRDKLSTYHTLAVNNLPVPRTVLLKRPYDADLVEKLLRFPIVVKTVSGQKGEGVVMVPSPSDFNDLLDLLSTTVGASNLIAQEFVHSSFGKDLRVLVVGGRVLAAMKRFSRTGHFKTNFSRGGSVKSHPITEEIEGLAVETARTLNLEIAGVDLLFDEDRFLVCEANSSPGFRGIERCHPDLNAAREILSHVVSFLSSWNR